MWVLILTLYIGESPSVSNTGPAFYTENRCQLAGDAWIQKTKTNFRGILDYASYTCAFTGVPTPVPTSKAPEKK